MQLLCCWLKNSMLSFALSFWADWTGQQGVQILMLGRIFSWSMEAAERARRSLHDSIWDKLRSQDSGVRTQESGLRSQDKTWWFGFFIVLRQYFFYVLRLQLTDRDQSSKLCGYGDKVTCLELKITAPNLCVKANEKYVHIESSPYEIQISNPFIHCISAFMYRTDLSTNCLFVIDSIFRTFWTVAKHL